MVKTSILICIFLAGCSTPTPQRYIPASFESYDKEPVNEWKYQAYKAVQKQIEARYNTP